MVKKTLSPRIHQRCMSQGIKKFVIDTSTLTNGQYVTLWEGPYYGFKIIKGSEPFARVITGKPGKHLNDTHPCIQGFGLHVGTGVRGDTPTNAPFDIFSIVTTDSNAQQTIEILLITSPMDIQPGLEGAPIVHFDSQAQIAAPGVNTPIINSVTSQVGIVPFWDGGIFNVQVVLAANDSVFNIIASRDDFVTEFSLGLNGSNALVTGDMYEFSFRAFQNWAYDFGIETDGAVQTLRLVEYLG